ncbi:MAG: protein-L-isoaspartate(D-aspartate) O-methyltransferase [Dehalococcoidia bacterium]|nr:protein-L-isoaspartate(D-aspartate) O-methyltransferase [Dehalococcoidia bacterium]
MEGGMGREKRVLFNNLRKEIHDEKVLRAMEKVPRELFVPSEGRHMAYKDVALPIGNGQTISQPYIIALMTSMLELRGDEKVLEVGTGSGYQAAILSHLLARGTVLTLERISSLARTAATTLDSLGCKNVEVRLADDRLGAPEDSPFNTIIVTAGSPKLPQSLMAQMAAGGRMVIPVGTRMEQELIRVVKTSEGHTVNVLGPCRFVPLIGRDAWPEK